MTLDIIEFKVCYDVNNPWHSDLIEDNRMVSSSFDQLYKSTVTAGGYAEMLHFYAVSSIIGQSMCPTTLRLI